MKYRNDLSQEYIKSKLEYNPEEGTFIWLASSGRAKKGYFAGGETGNGYKRILINKKSYLYHRLAWVYMTGDWPVEQIDHINGDGLDNRWINIREATAQQNMFNRPKNKENKSGHKGVCWNKEVKKWHASININRKLVHLGDFLDIEDAAIAYRLAADTHHKEFARY
tara:strand:+ start:652 stop:1152 length:501 start_codon:yes stop_codon:yes gene_type:complete